MTSYVLIRDGIVVQKQPYPQGGFIEAPSTVVCGYLYDGETFSAPPEPEPVPPTQEELDQEANTVAREALSEIMAQTLVMSDDTPEDTKRKIAPIFPRWAPDEVVVVGTMRRHGNGLYRCIQAHTTQEDWTPPDTPALWNETLPDGEIGPWSQPAGAHDAYQIGDKVTHNGATWTSTAANNVWEPGVYGWVEEN